MFILVFLFVLAAPAFAQLTDEQRQLNTASFETVWTTIRDTHWEKNPGGLNWQAVHDEFRPQIEAAASMDAARAVLRDMLGRLKQTHFAIFPFGPLDDAGSAEGGSAGAGFHFSLLDGHAIVTEVEAGSPAEQAGVKIGWEVLSAGGPEFPPVIAALHSDLALHELQIERAVLARLTGPPGTKRRFTFVDGGNARVALDLQLVAPRGDLAAFGNLPPSPVFFETHRIGNAGYIRFNTFLDLVRVMDAFGDAVTGCAKCDGIVIDLRGNPGGIGGMAMGMAGWLVDKPNLRLGTMLMRGATLNFVINPRPGAFTGPLAFLLDASSASTSEIFAGGLKDLGRARVFGTRSAAAALPSIIRKLPNGDGFQYAVANYISQGGQALESNGVTPDVEVQRTREGLLAGHDAVLDAALEWIAKQKGKP